MRMHSGAPEGLWLQRPALGLDSEITCREYPRARPAAPHSWFRPFSAGIVCGKNVHPACHHSPTAPLARRRARARRARSGRTGRSATPRGPLPDRARRISAGGETTWTNSLPPPPRTNRTRRVPHPVLIGHVDQQPAQDQKPCRRAKRCWGCAPRWCPSARATRPARRARRGRCPRCRSR